MFEVVIRRRSGLLSMESCTLSSSWVPWARGKRHHRDRQVSSDDKRFRRKAFRDTARSPLETTSHGETLKSTQNHHKNSCKNHMSTNHCQQGLQGYNIYLSGAIPNIKPTKVSLSGAIPFLFIRSKRMNGWFLYLCFPKQINMLTVSRSFISHAVLSS